MRIKNVRIKWFRGAGPAALLETSAKSVAVYGANGAGKSCFVDAIEFALNGRIEHLAHEYSGRHQERAVLNTHRPSDTEASIELQFADNSEVVLVIQGNGAFTKTGNGTKHLSGWDCRRAVLRQDEVARFIHSTKGQKYSVLLPLLGLGHLETAAENLRQLSSTILRKARVKEVEAAFRSARAHFERLYGETSPPTAAGAIESLCKTFVATEHTHSDDECLIQTYEEISSRLNNADKMHRIRIAVEALASIDIKNAVRMAKVSQGELAAAASGLVQLEVNVLRAVDEFLKSSPESLDTCPACGSDTDRRSMTEHVSNQLSRLENVIAKGRDYSRHLAVLRQEASRVISACSSAEVGSWLQSQGEDVRGAVRRAAEWVPPEEIVNWGDFREAELVLGGAVVAVASAAAFHHSETALLAQSKSKLEGAKTLLLAERAMVQAMRASLLAAEVSKRESGVREQIHQQAACVVADISHDIQRMWKTLHPHDPIEDVRLQIPSDEDKAIDVGLKFHGKELASPRLTLSEGYRNSLGLCVFLSMALRDSDNDRPIVLDDVIVSLDRGHRGMVAEVLEKEFAGRQVLLFTHDRDWYVDLKLQLSAQSWNFQALSPFREPLEGIRWSHKTGTFADARKHLTTRPDIAANEVRKVLDVELAGQAEKLQIPMPFARGDRNDKRTGHEFLSRFITVGRFAFQQQDDNGSYKPHTLALDDFILADKLLMTWANRGSHSEDVAPAEAEKLIDTCEAVLKHFKCPKCVRMVGFAETSSGAFQCGCGKLRWR